MEWLEQCTWFNWNEIDFTQQICLRKIVKEVDRPIILGMLQRIHKVTYVTINQIKQQITYKKYVHMYICTQFNK